tara:strand:- start:3395 stop:5701 length:2307 start_codon:yes stop_codon:yes gene_type:complete
MADKIVRIKLDSGGAVSDANRTNRAVKGIGASADSASSSMMSLSRVASGVITALSTAKIIQYADSWTNVNNRIAAATKTSREFSVAQSAIISIAQRAGVELSGVADAYSRISQATSELGVSQDRVIDVTEKLTLALKAGGATGAETSSVMIQFAQGLGSGALQGDELRSILEASIPITKALSKEFGVTTGELKKLGSEGKLTADRVVKAIENIDESSLTFTKDISSGFTELNNALTVYVGNIDQAFGVSKALSGSLSSLSQNIQAAVDVAGALALVVGAKYVGAVGAATASQLALTASSLKATTTMNAMGVVVSRTTMLMNAQALAARGASAALAFIGGPIGAAVIAAGALIYFADEAETAEERSTRLAGKVDNLTQSFKGLNDLQRQMQIKNLSIEFAETQAALQKANEKLQQFKSFSDSPIKADGVRRYQAEVNRLSGALDDISTKQQALFAGGIDNIQFTDATNQPKAQSSTGTGETQGNDGQIIAKLERENQMIQQSLLNRKSIYSQFFADANDLNATEYERQNAQLMFNLASQIESENQSFQTRLQAITDRQLALADNKSLNEAQKLEAQALLDEQAILARQQFENRITEISQEGAAQRALIDQQEAVNKINTYQGYANTALSLASAFGSKSEKANKKRRKRAVKIDTAAGIARAFAENDFYTALGISAIIGANGLKQLSAIDSASQPSSPSSASVSTPQPQPSANTGTQNQRRIIDLRGLENGGTATFSKEQLVELLNNDDDVILSVNNGQQQGARVGLING